MVSYEYGGRNIRRTSVHLICSTPFTETLQHGNLKETTMDLNEYPSGKKAEMRWTNIIKNEIREIIINKSELHMMVEHHFYFLSLTKSRRTEILRFGIQRTLYGTSWLGYELTWVRVDLGTSWLWYELTWVQYFGYELTWVRVDLFRKKSIRKIHIAYTKTIWYVQS